MPAYICSHKQVHLWCHYRCLFVVFISKQMHFINMYMMINCLKYIYLIRITSLLYFYLNQWPFAQINWLWFLFVKFFGILWKSVLEKKWLIFKKIAHVALYSLSDIFFFNMIQWSVITLLQWQELTAGETWLPLYL